MTEAPWPLASTTLRERTAVAVADPVLRQAVRRIEGMLTQHPELTHSVESIASDFVRTDAMARVAPPLEALRARRLVPRASTR